MSAVRSAVRGFCSRLDGLIDVRLVRGARSG
jgi:hypothetical protein